VVVVLGFMTIVRGIIFQEQDLVIITVVRIVIAASVNFPMLILSVYWPGLTTRGFGGLLGFVSSLVLIVVGSQF
jgi:cation/acetate symporter